MWGVMGCSQLPVPKRVEARNPRKISCLILGKVFNAAAGGLGLALAFSSVSIPPRRASRLDSGEALRYEWGILLQTESVFGPPRPV